MMATRTVDQLTEQNLVAPSRRVRRRRQKFWLGAPRAAVIVHVLTLVAGLAVLLHENAHLWFFGDDWEFIVNRGLHHPVYSIWQPHNEHWSTLPILWYRLLFTLFGLNYFPYIFSAIVAHLVLAHLLWRTCLRERVDPWIATTFVLLFVVLGSGAENLTWAFQITFISSLVFGYLALEMARRRASLLVDAAVSVLLLCALMCSTVGDAMVVAVTLFLVVSRGWLQGIRPVVVPVACYVIWFGLVGHTSVSSDHVTLTTVLGTPGSVWSGLEAALGSTFGLSDAGAALLVGLLAWTAYQFPRLYRAHPAVLGLGAGCGAFYFLVALGRSGAGSTSASRYCYVSLALLIPLMATLISLIKRPPIDIRVPVIGVLLVVIVANVGALRTFAVNRLALVQPVEEQIVTTATLVAHGVPSLVSAPVPYTPDLTTKAMRTFVDSGRLGQVPVSEKDRLTDEASMGVVATSRPLLSSQLRVVSDVDVSISPSSPGCSLVQANGPTPQLVVAAPASGGYVQLGGAAGAVIGVSVVQGSFDVPAEPITLDNTGHAFLNSDVEGGNLRLTLPSGATTVCHASMTPA